MGHGPSVEGKATQFSRQLLRADVHGGLALQPNSVSQPKGFRHLFFPNVYEARGQPPRTTQPADGRPNLDKLGELSTHLCTAAV